MLYRRARIVEDFGGGTFAIPHEDEVVSPEEPGRRVRPRHEQAHDDPPVIPVDDEVPMDGYNMEVRRYQDDLGRSMNYNNMALSHLFTHLNIPSMDTPDYPYVRSWDERIEARRSGAGGCGDGEDEE
jgi:hypothetical protein